MAVNGGRAGRYKGRLLLEPLPDGRRMKLFQSFGFIDEASIEWDVPAETIVDGASIPQALWSLMGGPFEGRYRVASVIHDYYCDTRRRPWRDVHRVFYEAMRASEVSETMAKVMYAAVYFKGPRWSETAVHNANLQSINRERSDDGRMFSLAQSEFQLRALESVSLDDLTARDFLRRGTASIPDGDTMSLKLDVLADAIAREHPSLSEIERALDGSVKVLEAPFRSRNRELKDVGGVDALL